MFKNINFLITKGNTLVIKGQSGTGKSTLLSLILGINIPTSGEILINDFSTSSCTINFDNILGYIGPEPYFINGTIKENLLYGLSKDRQITEMELWNALELMELKSLVMNLPNQLEESIFDIPQFSTGQKQRLSFSRAIIRRPSILILDEATANLDTATENKIIENLTPLFKNCTSVIVTHKNAFDKIATHEITL